MVTKYQKFGDGYKAEAVKLYRESNQTIAETARNLGLKESTLANCKYSEIVWLPMSRIASTSTNADRLTGLPNTYG